MATNNNDSLRGISFTEIDLTSRRLAAELGSLQFGGLDGSRPEREKRKDGLSREEAEQYTSWIAQYQPDRLLGQKCFMRSGVEVMVKARVEYNFILEGDGGNNLVCRVEGNLELETIPDIVLDEGYRKKIEVECFVSDFNETRNNEIVSLKRELERKVKYRNDTNEKMEEVGRDIARMEKELRGKKSVTLTLEDIQKELREIKKHVLVDKVGIHKKDIVIVTKMLQIRDPRSHRLIRHRENIDLGRFYIQIDFENRTMNAINLDYALDSANHPNISNYICWGDHGLAVARMLNSFQYYQVIDFFIEFVTTYPQHGAEPFVDYIIWLDKREKREEKIPSWMMTV